MQDDPRRTPGRTCPICGNPTESAWRPFCSRRCADIDLARWLKGAYAIPGADAEEESEEVNASSPATDEKQGTAREDE